ncbi:MAG TPA: 30S ribosomal protein S18 [Armatimonadota bacterium]|nr:30S ribosomal protein S18 [Armatimonadota bacterium]HOS44036.1 30S ribosomal protein S18 [Armatimonadota bacterium]
MTTGEGSPRPARDRGERGERGGRGGFRRSRPKVCQFCVDKVQSLDYKQLDRLTPMITERGKIKSRGQTGTCARHQRWVAAAIKRARHMALLPFVNR